MGYFFACLSTASRQENRLKNLSSDMSHNYHRQRIDILDITVHHRPYRIMFEKSTRVNVNEFFVMILSAVVRSVRKDFLSFS